LNKYKYAIVPTYNPPITQYELLEEIFLYPIWAKNEEEMFTVTVRPNHLKIISAVAVCVDQTDPSIKINFPIKDFVIFHSFIRNDSNPYVWFEKTYSSSMVYLKESKSKEEFVKSLDSGQPMMSDLFQKLLGNYNAFTPIIGKRSFKISYAETFKKFLKAKNEKMGIYNYIRMYEFAGNLSKVNSLYPNEALSFATLYTIFDSLVGSPSSCVNAITCDSCGRTVYHDMESLAQYQNRKLADILKPLYTQNVINQWQKLVKKINGLRSGTYHEAYFLNFMEEWLAENRKKGSKKQHTEEKWSIDRVITEFNTSFTAKQFGFFYFQDLIRKILILQLVHL
jgi:hypothetical protein